MNFDEGICIILIIILYFPRSFADSLQLGGYFLDHELFLGTQNYLYDLAE